ncbi:MAG: hypothetical protein A2Y14_05210 [Verrucomicrobia bacterium GWF2_51_19]|nr:MAG: hypothetical protein A2Y14_05210 [Verrucomicrobia bacterium GWF2_51_19]HCJ12351.1 hypothetical protein [Opitutae bacterium]
MKIIQKTLIISIFLWTHLHAHLIGQPGDGVGQLRTFNVLMNDLVGPEREELNNYEGLRGFREAELHAFHFEVDFRWHQYLVITENEPMEINPAFQLLLDLQQWLDESADGINSINDDGLTPLEWLYSEKERIDGLQNAFNELTVVGEHPYSFFDTLREGLESLGAVREI